MDVNLEEDWHNRFAAEKNNDLYVTPNYLVRDVSTTGAASDAECLAEYLADVQKVFSRVQHHMHLRTKSGHVPLKSCQRKTRK
eukprot:6372922-Karenia_brevis.AAC.1